MTCRFPFFAVSIFLIGPILVTSSAADPGARRAFADRVLLGDPATTEAGKYGAHKVFAATGDAFTMYNSETWGTALANFCKANNPDLLLMGSTAMGKDLGAVSEGNASYYIGHFPVANREKLDFFLEVTPKGEHTPLKAQLKQEFFTD